MVMQQASYHDCIVVWQARWVCTAVLYGELWLTIAVSSRVYRDDDDEVQAKPPKGRGKQVDDHQ